MTDIAWYWCLTHQRAEAAGDRDDPDNALGPYESPDAARDWKERSETRARAWKEQDEAWEDDDAEPGA